VLSALAEVGRSDDGLSRLHDVEEVGET